MENTNKQHSAILNKIAEGTQVFFKRYVALLLVLVLLSTSELLYNGLIHEFPGNAFYALFASYINDAASWLKYSFILWFLYIICYCITSGGAKFFFNFCAAILITTEILLIKYFSVALLPLGADLFGYSKEDILQTAGSSGALSFTSLSIFIFCGGFSILIFLWLPVRLKVNKYLANSLPLFSLVLLLTGISSSVYTTPFRSDFANNLIINKTDFFYTEAFRHFFPEDMETDIYSEGYLGVFDGGDNKSKLASLKYIDEENFPFLHADSTQDVLSPFFNKSAAPPHIVIVIAEGLGRAFTNDGAYLGNFTPFLDSLANKSVYFNNCFSSGGRTFAVLPSLLASLPFAKNGFLELGENIPPHLSLLSLLKSSGYHTSFYYGGDAHFDNMDIFLRKNAIDELNDGKTFPSGYTKLPSVNGFTWGYNDKELFRRYFNTRKAELQTPQLSVLLTVSSHNPFKINEYAKYLKAFDNRMAELGFNDTKKKNYQNYRDEYISILYTDDALRGFFDEYRKRDDFKNTIFLITGDHRMPEIPMSSKIDRYHVPLIIYSPLLKRTAKIESVSSHFDITPSLLAFLHSSYRVKRPGVATWLGQGLDTVRSFRNIHSYPLMQTKTNTADFIMEEYHLNNQIVYKMAANVDEEISLDRNKLDLLKAAFDEYKQRNERFLNGQKLIPDSIYRKYYPQK